jgi:hypothetical protein
VGAIIGNCIDVVSGFPDTVRSSTDTEDAPQFLQVKIIFLSKSNRGGLVYFKDSWQWMQRSIFSPIISDIFFEVDILDSPFIRKG